MCDYTQVEYYCGHVRYTVRAWCSNYETTHKRCPPNVVAVEWRLHEPCGDCRQPEIQQPWAPSSAKSSSSASSSSSSKSSKGSKSKKSYSR